MSIASHIAANIAAARLFFMKKQNSRQNYECPFLLRIANETKTLPACTMLPNELSSQIEFKLLFV